jgi:hypothetical protein
MSLSIRSQIMTAVAAALNAQGAPCKFWRCRQSEFQAAELPAGNFFPTDETNQIDGKENDCILTLEVAGVVSAVSDPVDEAADPLLVWIDQQLTVDGTFGGLATYTELRSIKWFMEQKGADLCGAIRTVDIHFRTALTDSTANES